MLSESDIKMMNLDINLSKKIGKLLFENGINKKWHDENKLS